MVKFSLKEQKTIDEKTTQLKQLEIDIKYVYKKRRDC